MSRLTMKNERGEFYPRRYKDGYGNTVVLSNEDCFDKLGHYEDLEEQGRLIEQRYATTRECCCSACKEDYTRVAEGENGMVWEGEYPNYCPWCGAKFVSEEELKEMEGAK